MVNGPPLTEEQKKARAGLKELFDTIDKTPLKVNELHVSDADYDDIVKWGANVAGSPRKEGSVE